jgi:hypothetical protein
MVQVYFDGIVWMFLTNWQKGVFVKSSDLFHEIFFSTAELMIIDILFLDLEGTASPVQA